MEIDLFQRTLDEARLVANHLHPEIRRHDRLELGQALLDPVNDLDRVAAGLFADDEGDTVLAIGFGECARLFDRVRDRREILEAHGLSGRVCDDQLVEVLDFGHPAQGADDELARFLVEPPAGHFEILSGQGPPHVLNDQVVGAELLDIDGNLHRPGAGADQADRPHIGHRFQVLFDELVRDVADFPQIAGRADADGEDRNRVQVKLVDDRRIGPGGKAGENGVDLVAHVLGRDIPISFQEKLDDDLRHPLGGDAAQLVDPLNGVDDLLQGLGDARFHFLRGRPSQRRGHGNDGQFDIGKLVDANIAEGKPAQHHQEQVDHGGEDRSPDAKVGNAQAFGLGGRGR